MASFLDKCKRCGSMIAKGAICPNCRYSGEETAEKSELSAAFLEEYQIRYSRHRRNYALFMILMLLTGFVGLYTAVLWVRVIYFGNIGAFVLIGVMTIVSLILGALLAGSRKIFPVDLNCPSCSIRLDELGLNNGHCPGCNVQMKHLENPG